MYRRDRSVYKIRWSLKSMTMTWSQPWNIVTCQMPGAIKKCLSIIYLSRYSALCEWRAPVWFWSGRWRGSHKSKWTKKSRSKSMRSTFLRKISRRKPKCAKYICQRDLISERKNISERKSSRPKGRFCVEVLIAWQITKTSTKTSIKHQLIMATKATEHCFFTLPNCLDKFYAEQKYFSSDSGIFHSLTLRQR